jgi:hypothetical protein
VSKNPLQLELPLTARSSARVRVAPTLRLIRGGGPRAPEKLASREAVVRVLVEAGADLLLRRISPERAREIERTVDQVLGLFDRVDQIPALMPVLQRELDGLESLMKETRAGRGRRSGR